MLSSLTQESQQVNTLYVSYVNTELGLEIENNLKWIQQTDHVYLVSGISVMSSQIFRIEFKVI